MDLLDTPIEAVDTRTITSPRWGAGRREDRSTGVPLALATQDRGGGLVIVPGPTGATLPGAGLRPTRPSARVGHDLGGSFAGPVTDREVEGGGTTVSSGRIFQWLLGAGRPATGRRSSASHRDPDRSDLSRRTGTGRSFSSWATASYQHTTETLKLERSLKDYGDGFGADVGVRTPGGLREAQVAGEHVPPEGVLQQVQPSRQALHQFDTEGAELTRRAFVGAFFQGGYNLGEDRPDERSRPGGGQLLRRSNRDRATIDPSRRAASRIGNDGFLARRSTTPTPGRGTEARSASRHRAADGPPRAGGIAGHLQWPT